MFRHTVDGGPDWNLTSWPVLLYAWRQLKLLDGEVDCLQFDSNSADRSRYNCIEHLWSVTSNVLTSVIFSACATGDDTAPCLLPRAAATDEERRLKEVEVFDNALAELQTFWRHKTFNGHIISTSAVAALQSNNTFTSDAHALLLSVLELSKAKIVQNPELLAIIDELVEACRHADRRRNFLAVQKCDEDKACAWCKSRPWKARNVYAFLKARDMKFPTVMESQHFSKHNMTWLEVKEVAGLWQAGYKRLLDITKWPCHVF